MGAVAALLGAVLLYARAELFAPEALAGHAASALDDEDVRLAVAPSIVRAIDGVSPGDALSNREVADALADPRVTEVFGDAAALATRQLFNKGSRDLDLDLAKVTTVAIAATKGVSPAELGVSASAFDSAHLDLIGGQTVLDALDSAQSVSWLGFVLAPLGLLAMLISIPLAPDALRGLRTTALALAVVAGLVVVALYVGHEIVVAQFHDNLTRDAVSSAWDALLGGLRTGLLVTAGASAVVALGSGAAASRRGPAW